MMSNAFKLSVKSFAYVLLAILFFLILLLILVFPLQPVGLPLQQWQVKEGASWKSVEMPWVEMFQPDRRDLEMRAVFNRVDADTLVIPRMSGNALEIRLNHRLIYRLGDFSQPTANLWNYIQLIQLPEPLQAENLLEVRIASSYYGYGFNSIPYLCRYQDCAVRVGLLNAMYSDTSNAIIGAGVLVGFVLIAMSIIRKKRKSPELFIGLALIFGIVFLLDLPFRLTTGTVATFLWAKKGFLISGYLAALWLLWGIELQYWQKIRIGRWLSLYTLAAVIALLLSSDIKTIAVVQNYTNTGLTIFLTIVVGLILFRKERPTWLLFPATLLLLSIMLLLISIPLRLTWPTMIPTAFIFTVMMVGVQLLLDYNQLVFQNLNLQRMKNLDPLTGALNRNILSEVEQQNYGYVVMVDLDEFKIINDRFGHQFGDQVLKDFTRLVKANLRQNDLVIRYGGDEFVLLLSTQNTQQPKMDEVVLIIDRIQKQCADLYTAFPLGFSYGVAPVQNSLEEAIAEADRAMYLSKDAKSKADPLPKI